MCIYNETDRILVQVISKNQELRSYCGTNPPNVHSAFRYQAVALIGQGSYGKVILIRNRPTGEMVIVKIPFDIDNDGEYITSMLQEYMYQEEKPLTCWEVHSILP